MREGFIPCHAPGCSNPEAAVRETPAGTLAYSCHRCQFSGFAKKGTKSYAAILAMIDAPTDPAPVAQAKPTPPTTKQRAGFDLAQL